MKMFKTLTLVMLVFTSLSIISCTNYGKKEKSGHVEVYYKDAANKELAKRTAEYMEMADKQAGNQLVDKSFQVLGGPGSYTLKMVAVKEKLKDVPEETFSQMTSVMSEAVFGGKPVALELTNDKFETFKTYEYKKYDVDTIQ